MEPVRLDPEQAHCPRVGRRRRHGGLQLLTTDARKKRIALIGAGSISTIHLSTLVESPHVELVAIADVDLERASRQAKAFGVPRAYGAVDALFDEETLDAVDIALPHDQHVSIARHALDRGIDVICEKPLGTSTSEAWELISLAHAEGRTILVKSYQRAAEPLARLARLLHEGAVGTPYLATALFASDRRSALADPTDWHADWQRCGGGVFIDSGYHLVDGFRMLFGEVKEVVAAYGGSTYRAPDKAEDHGTLLLTFAGKVIGSVTCTWLDTSQEFRTERRVFGDGGSLELHETYARAVLRGFRSGRVFVEETFDDAWPRANAAAMDVMIERLCAGGDAGASAEEAVRTLRVLEAGYESSRRGCAVTVTTDHDDAV